MNILIIGAGRVGRELAKVFSAHNDVTIVDNDPDRLSKVAEDLDILPVLGDAVEPGTYEAFREKDTAFDVAIAVTNADEVNIVACMLICDLMSVARRIARINHESLDYEAMRARTGIDMFISPHHQAAMSVIDLVEHSWARDIIHFRFDCVKALALQIDDENLDGISVYELMKNFRGRTIVCAIERYNGEHGGELVIPRGNTRIHLRDYIYFLGTESDLHTFAETSKIPLPKFPKRCVVLGANNIGIKVAQKLIEKGASVKLLDRDEKECERAAMILQDQALVINDRHSTQGIFYQESLYLADLLISATMDDEYNLIMGISALRTGIKRAICLNSNADYYETAHSMGIDVAVGPKLATVTGIVQRLSSEKIVSESSFLGGRGMVLHWVVHEKSSVIGKRISEIAFPEGALAVAAIRNGTAIIVTGDFEPQEGDTIIIFCKHESLASVKKQIAR
ncbi:NAD-binding protein [Desulfurispirillum indicum]|uniref:Trk system potassium uptake protein TrkA n=1 Tax=Desulfurispirillum indicum (strain ATCC BAA-1389 / DSM 22839 / S5) TaxID=653733 RepID=E6W3X8_DESIS|nr:NAD-binding protein [Desulfurispirillum indicum]ADU65846.1 TrkA-N domain protein [Desulfurispirillum indicum S5]UCZ57782.1 NAD-binding protein [Desulfurispirillum indicum]